MLIKKTVNSHHLKLSLLFQRTLKYSEFWIFFPDSIEVFFYLHKFSFGKKKKKKRIIIFETVRSIIGVNFLIVSKTRLKKNQTTLKTRNQV